MILLISKYSCCIERTLFCAPVINHDEEFRKDDIVTVHIKKIPKILLAVSSKTMGSNNDNNDDDENQQQQTHELEETTNDQSIDVLMLRSPPPTPPYRTAATATTAIPNPLATTTAPTAVTVSCPNTDDSCGDEIVQNNRIENTTSSQITQQQPEEQSSLPLGAAVAASPPPNKPIKLIKSTRLKGYMTLTLAAFIHLDAARTSSNIDTNAITIVPSTDSQRLYAQITAIISMIGTTICCLIHFDRITPLQNKIWIPIFFHTNGTSMYEGSMILFYTLWWSIATGIATSVNGIAGDGKGQYSLYYSTWAC